MASRGARSIAALAFALAALAALGLLRSRDAGPPPAGAAPSAPLAMAAPATHAAELQPTHVAPAAIPPEHAALPLRERDIRPPDPGQPAASPTAGFCDHAHWSRLDLLAGSDPAAERAGEFRVDPPAWRRNLASTRAGIASWMSQCRSHGGAVRIVAADTGSLLATWDPARGLREPGS